MMRLRHLRSVLCSLLFLGLYKAVKSLPCEDSQCRTSLCNGDGACICEIPDPSTKGRFCDEEMTMCDGTNSFWCEHGGKCDEVVQGEVYTCKCHRGYAGEHCELVGVPCGNIYCFLGAECSVEEGDSCDCPPAWRGSPGCSVPTDSSTGSSKNSSMTGLHQSGNSGTSGVLVFFLVLCSFGAVWVVVIYAKNNLLNGKRKAAVELPQSSQRQTYRVLDEEVDEDNSTEMETIRNDNFPPLVWSIFSEIDLNYRM